MGPVRSTKIWPFGTVLNNCPKSNQSPPGRDREFGLELVDASLLLLLLLPPRDRFKPPAAWLLLGEVPFEGVAVVVFASSSL